MSQFLYLYRMADAARQEGRGADPAIAVGQRDGADRGLEALRAIGDADRLAHYPFYPAAMGELESRRGTLAAARRHFSAAAALARSGSERRFLEKRARECAPISIAQAK
jgi:RNA polymerase sigma-70 factor (ECF subfamily)